MRLVLPVAALLLLALAACETDEATPTPTPAATETPIPTAAFTPLPPLPAELIDPDSVAERSGGFVFDARSGDLWWLRDRRGIWSPDGNTLLVTVCCIGSGGIQLIDLPSGKATGIYHGDVAAAAWSPDGRRIAFATHGASGPEDLYVVNRDGTGIRKLSEGAGWAVAWSPSGNYVALSADGGLRIAEVTTAEATDVSDADAWAWSPDGRSLALANQTGLSLYDIATRGRRQVAEG